jgi:phosphate starvation-inducible membrane PsiE
MIRLNRKEWHETFLKMVASASMITFIIYMSCWIIYFLLAQTSQYNLIQNIVISFSFISLFILTMQTLRSMYQVYYLPLMNSCRLNYQKIIFFCCSFSIALIVVSSFLLNFAKMLKDYYS